MDMDEIKEEAVKNIEAILEMEAGWIRDGKDFLCRTLSASRARLILAKGLVTEDQCRRVGLI